MEITVCDSHNPLVMIHGEIDYSNSDRLRDTLGELVVKGPSIDMDLSGVRFIDSSGIGVLVDCARNSRLRGGIFRLLEFSDNVYRPISHLGLIGILGLAGRPDDTPVVCESQPISNMFVLSSFSLPARRSSPAVIRERIRQVLADLALSGEEAADVELAVGEAATNAVKYGGQNGRGQVSVRCFADGHVLEIRVSDHGPGFDPDAVCEADFQSLPLGSFPLGRMGIKIMKKSMDEVSFEFSKGTTVCMVKYLHS